MLSPVYTNGMRIVALSVALAGCSQSYLTVETPPPETPDLSGAPYPRLVDTPTPVPLGEFGPGAPNPADGLAIIVTLEAEAEAAAEDRTARKTYWAGLEPLEIPGGR